MKSFIAQYRDAAAKRALPQDAGRDRRHAAPHRARPRDFPGGCRNSGPQGRLGLIKPPEPGIKGASRPPFHLATSPCPEPPRIGLIAFGRVQQLRLRRLVKRAHHLAGAAHDQRAIGISLPSVISATAPTRQPLPDPRAVQQRRPHADQRALPITQPCSIAL